MKINHLILFVTTKCNSKCIMCFNYNLNKQDVDELTLGEYERTAKNLKSRLRCLMISGGEPSLRDDLPEICWSFYDQCEARKILLPLNGHDTKRTMDIVERTARLCPRATLNVGLSIDGMAKIHDIQRGIDGSFDKVMATHEALFELSKKYSHIKRGVITTVTKTNVNQLEELARFIHDLPSQPDYHDIMICRIQAGRKTDRRLLIEHGEYRRILDIAGRYAYRYSRKRYGSRILGIAGYIRHKMLDHVYLNAYKNKQIITCKAPDFIRVIEADGGVRICEFNDPIANVRDYDYDLNKISRNPNPSFEKVDCACTHPCFVVPSFGYLSNILRTCISIFTNNIRRQKNTI